jgi:hypothetical protein
MAEFDEHLMLKVTLFMLREDLSLRLALTIIANDPVFDRLTSTYWQRGPGQPEYLLFLLRANTP